MTTDTENPRLCWADVRTAGETRPAVIAEAIHHGLDAIVTDRLADLADLPPTIRKVLMPGPGPLPASLAPADVVIVDPAHHGDPRELAWHHAGIEFGQFVDVSDAQTLDVACRSAREHKWTVVLFRDPTKIPLEIVLAAAADAKGNVITVCTDPTDAAIVFGVLEHGSEGVLMPVDEPGQAAGLREASRTGTESLILTELTVVATTPVGMGERACVDTCSQLRPNEGILVGSRSRGLVLCVSETHPLPYMPTRPFRVNAGALMSYTLADTGRTQYLSELRAGSHVLAVDTDGRTRRVTVGRVKIESRPLLSIDVVADDGRTANLIVQNDWHVRVLGPGGAVLNSTALTAGDRVLGYLPVRDRHVGYPIDELCIEQ